MEKEINSAKESFEQAIKNVRDEQSLEAVRIKYLGRKGLVSELMGKLLELDKEKKPAAGKNLNILKKDIQKRLQEKTDELLSGQSEKEKRIDITMPGLLPDEGHLHPITKTLNEINDIFISLGFRIAEGPEIEKEFYNFEALNIPLEHPSRDAFDTFYIKKTFF